MPEDPVFEFEEDIERSLKFRSMGVIEVNEDEFPPLRFPLRRLVSSLVGLTTVLVFLALLPRLDAGGGCRTVMEEDGS